MDKGIFPDTVCFFYKRSTNFAQLLFCIYISQRSLMLSVAASVPSTIDRFEPGLVWLLQSGVLVSSTLPVIPG
jgi:hypothetical protein